MQAFNFFVWFLVLYLSLIAAIGASADDVHPVAVDQNSISLKSNFEIADGQVCERPKDVCSYFPNPVIQSNLNERILSSRAWKTVSRLHPDLETSTRAEHFRDLIKEYLICLTSAARQSNVELTSKRWIPVLLNQTFKSAELERASQLRRALIAELGETTVLDAENDLPFKNKEQIKPFAVGNFEADF